MGRAHQGAFLSGSRRIAWTLLFGVCVGAPLAGADEIYRWTDAQGNVHFGNRKPAAARSVETTEGGTLNQTGGTAQPQPTAKPADERTERLRKLQEVNEQGDPASSDPTLLGVGGRLQDSRDPTHNESWCQVTYGKSCDELDNWRDKAVDDCARRGSAHCDDSGWIDRYEPKTVERQRELEEERRESATRRDNRLR